MPTVSQWTLLLAVIKLVFVLVYMYWYICIGMRMHLGLTIGPRLYKSETLLFQYVVGKHHCTSIMIKPRSNE